MRIVRYGALFFLILCIEALHISIFRYGNIMVVFLLFLVFFSNQRTAFASACIAGFLEDAVVGSFGFHIVVYPLITLCGSMICGTLLTNKSFSAFFLLGAFGFSSLHISGMALFVFQETIPRGSDFFRTFFSLSYGKEILYGFFIQTVVLVFAYGMRHQYMRNAYGH